MMMDWVSPACGGCGRSVFGGRPRLLHGRCGLTATLAGAGRGGAPSGMVACPGVRIVDIVSDHWADLHRGERVVAECGEQMAGLPDDTAGPGQGGPLSVDAFLYARGVGGVGGGGAGGGVF